MPNAALSDTVGPVPNLRERTRQAVRKEIAAAATALVIDRGYDATTIEDIAAGAGMSKRSVFRYFTTKEEIFAGKFDEGAARMLDILRERPPDEPVWTSLRQLFAVVDEPESTKAIQRVIIETPALLAFYLQKLQGLQNAVVDVLKERRSYAATDPTPRALAAAAFGCLVSAQYTWLDDPSDTPLIDYIDQAMAALTPRP
jgi:AcrR family transcriptional regulator